MLLSGNNIGPSKLRVCGHGLNGSVHNGISTSNVKVHLGSHSGNVNIQI